MKYHLMSVMLLASVGMTAQETYINAELATKDLNGTARYVGMGGAMDALGADLSTISTNPAGIGLFRHSAANLSFGLVTQEDAQEFANGNKTNMSFDQAGFVYSTRMGQSSFLNFAFNYHKSRNFNHILNAAGRTLNGGSQNLVSYNKGYAGMDVFIENDEVLSNDYAYSQLDYLYYNAMIYNPYVDLNPDPNKKEIFFPAYAERYMMDRVQTGYIGQYDFNISGNLNNRVYLGVTIGVHDVHYKSYSEYAELYDKGTVDDYGLGGVLVEDTREITGTGFDLKAGVIFRPIEDSPFRIGLSVATPTWYDLTTRNYTAMYKDVDENHPHYNGINGWDIDNSYDFKLHTPWKFGLSLGHTIDNFIALGASYEFADYGSLDSREIDGYDWDGNTTSSTDIPMKRHAEQTLKGVSTLKLGAEVMVAPQLFVRAGYNYVSPMYNKHGYKDGTLASYGVTDQSQTDYTNWKATQRLTAGVGCRLGKFSLDLAYQYSQTDGTFTPFKDVLDATNVAESVDVSNKRNQVLLTMGYTF